MIDTKAPRRSTTPDIKINVADVVDWEKRAKTAEQRLLIERTKLRQEQEKVRRLRYHGRTYIDALAHCVEDCTQMRNHCQILAGQNLALSHQFERAKLVVQTLEAIIPKACLSCSEGGCST